MDQYDYTSNGVDLPNRNFFVWHYTQALPAFVSSRLGKFSQNFAYFNLSGLLKNLFAPYRRMTLAKTGPGNLIDKFIDKLSFNLISRSIGAITRIIFLLIGAFALVLFVLFDLLVILFYLIPIFSLPKYLKLRSQFVLDAEAKDPQALLKKLSPTPYVKTLSLFFDEDFKNLFEGKFTTSETLPLNPTVENIVDFLFKNVPAFKKYLEQKNIDSQDLAILQTAVAGRLNLPKIRPLAPFGGFLGFGYTNTLDHFSRKVYPSPVVPNRESQEIVENIEQILTRQKNNNVLLVGEPGTGRHTTLNYLALALGDPKNKGLFGKRLLMLDTVAVAGQGKNLSQIKSIFEDILEEAKAAGGIILAIDEIDRLVSSQEERIDISQVIGDVLKDAGLPLIAITTLDNFNEFVRPNTSFLKYFEKIDIEEPGKTQTLGILTDKILENFAKTKVSATLSSLKEIVERSQTLIPDQKQPQKSLNLLEDAVSRAQDSQKDKIDVALVDQILSAKTKTPLGQIGKTEAKKLKDLETILHLRIVGQETAIDQLARAMRRARSGIETGKRPIGSFLFLGPTGVGKTATAKALAAAYFGSEEKMVRLDMSEFQGADSLDRLIGDNKSKTPGQLANLIRQNPYGLLLVDEFEKANSTVHNLFLQILDEGFLTDAFGKKVSFDNVIIIATSNAGSEFIREEISSSQSTVDSSQKKNTVNREPLTKNLINYILEKGIFSPELVNRFDGVIVYSPLTQDQTVAVTKLMLDDLAKELKETKNITLEITPELSAKVAEEGYDQEFGARPIRRLIQDKIEDEIAKMIIDESIKNGGTIPADILLKFLS